MQIWKHNVMQFQTMNTERNETEKCIRRFLLLNVFIIVSVRMHLLQF